MRILFFFLGVPMMLMSFFEAVDIMPFVSSSSVIVNGNEIVLSEEQQETLEQQVLNMLEHAHTLPAFGVVFNEMYQEIIKEGNFVSLKFDKVMELNELPFDEIVFKVDSQAQGFDMMRGIKGVFQGRCVHIDLLGNNMEQLQETIDSFSQLNDVDDNNETDIVEDVGKNEEEIVEEETV